MYKKRFVKIVESNNKKYPIYCKNPEFVNSNGFTIAESSKFNNLH